MIDPGAITFAQTMFLDNIMSVFGVVSGYALDLLYIFAAIEIVIFGLLWAFGQSGWERFFFKVLKIGLIFFIIQNYSYLADVIVRSLVQVGGAVAHTKELESFIFNPAKLWQYGYNEGVMLLKLAATGSNIGLPMLYIMLGSGILMVFGLLGIQVVLQLSGFYLVAMTSLLFIPFGTFTPAQGMFNRSVQSVLKAAVRVMVIIMVIGVAVTVWSSFALTSVTPDHLPIPFNINQPLGLFFTGLLFLYLAIRLPKMAAESVGSISMRLIEGNTTQTIVSREGSNELQSAASASLGEMQAATTINGGNPGFAMSSGTMVSGMLSHLASATPVTVSVGSSSMRGGGSGDLKLSQASELCKSISDQTMKKLEKTLVRVLDKKG
ncbi:MAG: hypothetical protein A3C55_01885 [Gammaproteobacteria bacterium RIFCSPHIGHO2_02_FULL_42_13]|nr:MAG: hypothetical protein A3C55_01885 [Gammaproteobacteria bacterium RIFCSPHIGHO2_02_FULL_42_13]OGT70041.1 MAG: hypothetical protein A3H43_05750 [Gammaproteobacteria bacterium RIFCSPLOWO2_02_FULL_42_9]